MSRLVRKEGRNAYGIYHTYELDKVSVRGATTIIGAGLPFQAGKQWAANEAANEAVNHWDEIAELPLTDRLNRIRFAYKKVSDEAKLRGTLIHTYGEILVHGGTVEDPQYVGPAEAYAKFIDRWQIDPIATETPLANTQHKYGGTADLWCRIGVRDGERALVDLKSGKDAYPDVALQLAAYRYADLWQPDGPESESDDVPDVDACYVFHILTDDVQMLPVQVDANHFRSFLYVQQVSEWARLHQGYPEPQVRVIGEAIQP